MNNEPVFAYLRAKCPVCGKEFYKRCEDWGWMYGGKACCTYSCMRKLEREEQSSKKDKITKQLQGDSQYEEKKKRIRMPRKDGREISTEQKE